MCFTSLVKNPYLQIENKHRKLLYKREQEGSKNSGDDINSIESDHRSMHMFRNHSRGESPASGIHPRKYSFADSESVISEGDEYEGHGSS